MSAAVPSAFAEEAAGVMVPLERNAAFNPGILAGPLRRMFVVRDDPWPSRFGQLNRRNLGLEPAAFA
jgi:hypothetical protein